MSEDCSKFHKSKIYRSGKVKGEHVTGRPIRRCTDIVENKWDILKTINYARFEGTFARLDLSKSKRKDFLLRQGLKEARQQEAGATVKIVKKQMMKISS